MAFQRIEVQGRYKSLEAAEGEARRRLEAHGYEDIKLVEDSVISPDETSDRWSLGFRVTEPPPKAG
jgi:hypothetical protein